MSLPALARRSSCARARPRRRGARRGPRGRRRPAPAAGASQSFSPVAGFTTGSVPPSRGRRAGRRRRASRRGAAASRARGSVIAVGLLHDCGDLPRLRGGGRGPRRGRLATGPDPTEADQGVARGAGTIRAKSRSSARAGSSQRPEWTGETWMIVLRGATSQWKRSRGVSRPMGPLPSPPAAIARDRRRGAPRPPRGRRPGRARGARSRSSSTCAPRKSRSEAEEDRRPRSRTPRARRAGRRARRRSQTSGCAGTLRLLDEGRRRGEAAREVVDVGGAVRRRASRSAARPRATRPARPRRRARAPRARAAARAAAPAAASPVAQGRST